MSEKKPYSDKRWTQPLGGKIVDHVEFTPEEREKSRLQLLRIMEEMAPDKK